jgi:hypothetical protein
MRIQEARRVVNKAFKQSTFNDNGIVNIKRFKTPVVIRAVDTMTKWHTKQEAEFPTDVYYKDCLHNPTAVISHLEYIADRWKCAGRLMFLQAVMELY